MPRILEFKEIDDAMWVRLDLTKEQSPVHLYTHAEIEALEQTDRNAAIEECAALADAHHPPELRKGIDPEAMDTINSERRGELIAADEIAVRIRRLKTKPLS